MEEASEPDSLSVGLGQVSSLWVCFLPKRDRVWDKQRLLHFPEKADHPGSWLSGGEPRQGKWSWEQVLGGGGGTVPPVPLFPGIVTL